MDPRVTDIYHSCICIFMRVLSELFSDCSQIKIIEAFAENCNEKLYVADIVRIAGVSKLTVMRHVKKLLKEGILRKRELLGMFNFIS